MSGIYAQGPTEYRSDTTMRDLLAVIFKRKWLILGIFLTVTALIAARVISAPVTYTAHARLMLNRAGLRVSELDRYARSLPWVEVVESELEVATSASVIEGARQKLLAGFETPGDSLRIGFGKLQRSIKVSVIGESNVLAVSATADSPRAAALIANAVAESYVEHHRELFKLPDVMVMIRAQADSVQNALTGLRAERVSALGGVGLTDLHDEESLLIQRRKKLEAELDELQVDQARLQIEVEGARTFLLNPSSQIPFSEDRGSVQGGTLSDSINDIRRRESELQQLRSKYTSAHPRVIESEQELASLRQFVRDAAANLIATKEHALRGTDREVQVVERQIAETDARLAQMPQLRERLITLDTQIVQATDQHKALQSQAMETELNSAGFVDYGVKLLSPAMHGTRNAKGDMVRMALGPILALMAGIGLAFYLENMDHTLSNREDLEQHLEIPVLASFPDVDLELGERGSEPKPPRRRVPFGRKGLGG